MRLLSGGLEGQLENSRLMHALDRMARYRYIVLSLYAVLLLLLRQHSAQTDWHFFAQGADWLMHGTSYSHVRQHVVATPTGLHLYASHPELQIGPLALALTALCQLVAGSGAHFLVGLLGLLLGLAVIRGLESTAYAARQSVGTQMRWFTSGVLLGGILLLTCWSDMSVAWSHIDDALALSLLVGAMYAVARRRPWMCGVAFGLAIDAKPWALYAAALLLAMPQRHLLRAALASAVTVVAAWLPFVLAAPQTLHAVSGYRIPVLRDSVLHLLDPGAQVTPTWCRLVQLLVSVLLGALAVRRGRWTSVLGIAVAVRLMLDPGTFSYYTAGLIVGVAGWELGIAALPFPLLSTAAYALLTDQDRFLIDLRLSAVLRLGVCLVVLLALLGRKKIPADGSSRFPRPPMQRVSEELVPNGGRLTISP